MTEEKKLDTVLKLFKDRLSRHPTDKEWNNLAQKICATNRNSSAFQTYERRLIADKLIEKDNDGNLTASHFGITYSYVKNERYKRIDKFFKIMSGIAITGASLVTILYYSFELCKSISHNKQTSQTEKIPPKTALTSDSTRIKK